MPKRAERARLNLESLVAPYREELTARHFEDPAVKAGKLALLDLLVQFDDSPAAPDHLGQIKTKLDVLGRIEFGSGAGRDIHRSLEKISSGERVQYKTSTFVKNFVDKLLQFFGYRPHQHFDDVINSVKTTLQAACSTLSYGTPEEVAAGTKLSSALLASGREETMGGAMRDFARSVSLGGTVYRQPDGVDEAYTAQMVQRILDFTGEKDITKGIAGEMAHVAGQTNVAHLLDEMYDAIPAFDMRSESSPGIAMAMMRPGELAWGKDERGYFLDQEFKVLAANSKEDPSQFYVADPSPDATEPRITLNTREAMDISQGKAASEALVTCRARIRYSLAKGTDRPTPTVESFSIYNRYPDFFKFSPEAEAHLREGLASSSHSGAPAWVHATETHAHAATTSAHPGVPPAVSHEGEGEGGVGAGPSSGHP